MRKWLYSFGSILTTLVIIFLLLPFAMGFIAQSKHKHIINVINSNTPLKAETINYQRGWFSSNTTTQITIDQAETQGQKTFQTTTTTHVKHGPVIINWPHIQFAIATINTDFNFDENQNDLLRNTPDNDPIATAKIKIKLNATTHASFECPALSYQDKGKSLQWKGLNIVAEFSQMFNQTQAKFFLPGFAVTVKDNSLNLSGAVINYNIKKISNNVWFGKRDLQIKSFSIKNNQNPTIALSGLNIHTLIDDDKDLVNASINIELDSLNIGNDSYTKNNLDLEINKADKTAFIELYQFLNPHKNSSAQPESSIFDSLIALTSNGGEINIKQLNTTSSWGKLLTTIKIIFAEQKNNKNPFLIITNSTVNTDIRIERDFAVHLLKNFYGKPGEQAEDLLAEWQQSGKITTSDKDSYLHMIFDYQKGDPLLNGKPLTITTKT